MIMLAALLTVGTVIGYITLRCLLDVCMEFITQEKDAANMEILMNTYLAVV